MAIGSFFSNLRGARSSASAPAKVEPSSIPIPEVDERIAYPPVDPGIPVHSAEDILSSHDDLIRRIKLAYGADGQTFSNDLMVLMRRYAQYVNLLPATPDNYFSGPGGLLRMGLEIAFYALQATDGQIFSGRSTITNRRQLEPRWRHATFIAGLCSEIHRTLSHVLVTDEQGNEWPSYLLPLTDWLLERNANRFFLRWTLDAQEVRSLGVFALPRILPAETLHHLAQNNAIVVPHMMASISGMPVYREHNILDQLVRHATALVIDRDLQASAHRYGKPQLGAHLERYLVDALRRLIASNNGWAPNSEKSRVWYGRDGLYIVWPNAVTEVIKLLETDQLPGIPKSPETILEILADAGVVEPRDPSQVTWLIFPPDAKSPIEAIKLSSPAILLGALAVSPKPLSDVLVKPHPAPTKKATPAPSSSKKTSFGMQLPLPGTLPDEEDVGIPQEPVNADIPPAAIPEEEAIESMPQPPSVEASTSSFSLAAPMRLNSTLRSALAEIVETMNDGAGTPACRSISAGLFIPLSELERRQIDPSTAIRILFDVSMLVIGQPGNAKTVTHDFGGEEKLGIVLAPRFIAGFDPNDFQVIAGGSDAGP